MQAPNRASTAGYNRLDPFPWYAQMRASAPVFREAHGAWHVFGYADVQHVLSDYATLNIKLRCVELGADSVFTKGEFKAFVDYVLALRPNESLSLRRS